MYPLWLALVMKVVDATDNLKSNGVICLIDLLILDFILVVTATLIVHGATVLKIIFVARCIANVI